MSRVIETNNKDFAMACWECGYTVKYIGGREKVRQYIPYEELYGDNNEDISSKKIIRIGKAR